MELALHIGEPLPHGLRRVALSEIDKAIDHLTTQQPDLETAVHEARKSGKRVRAVLRLVRDEIGEDLFKRENVRVRDAARLLAPVRDSTVMIEALDALLAHFVIDSGDYAALRQRLAARSQRLSGQILHNPAVIAGVTATFHTARFQADRWPMQNADFDAIRPGLHRVYRRGRRRMSRAYADPQPERFHDWRKRVKYLWHQLEILTPVQPSLLTIMTEDLHTLSGYLGDDHDLAELARLIAKEGDLLPEPALLHSLLRLIEQRRRDLQTLAGALGAQLFAATPVDFVQQIADLWHDWRRQFPAYPGRPSGNS